MEPIAVERETWGRVKPEYEAGLPRASQSTPVAPEERTLLAARVADVDMQRGGRATLRRTLLGVVLIALLASSMGCSVIGFTGGAIADGGKPDAVPRTTPEVLALARGSAIEAVLSDGSTVTGTYTDLLAESGESYGPAFARSRESLLPEHPIPRLGSRVGVGRENIPEVYTRPGAMLVYTPSMGELLGFDQEGVLLTRDGNTKKFRWEGVHSLSYREGKIEGNMLAELTATGRIPSISGICLQDGDVRTPVSFSEVREFRTRSSRNAKWSGLGLGLIVDGVLVALIASIEWDPVWGP